MATGKKDETSSSQASQTPETKPAPAVQPVDEDTASATKQPATSKPDESTQETAEQPARKHDETVPGGLYISGDRVINAEGQEVKGWTVSKDGKSMRKSDNPLTQAKDNA